MRGKIGDYWIASLTHHRCPHVCTVMFLKLWAEEEHCDEHLKVATVKLDKEQGQLERLQSWSSSREDINWRLFLAATPACFVVNQKAALSTRVHSWGPNALQSDLPWIAPPNVESPALRSLKLGEIFRIKHCHSIKSLNIWLLNELKLCYLTEFSSILLHS